MAKTTLGGSIFPTLIVLIALVSFIAFYLFQTPLPFFPCFGFQKLWAISGWLSSFSIALMMHHEFQQIKYVRYKLYHVFFPFRKRLKEKKGIDYQGSLGDDIRRLMLRYLFLYFCLLSSFLALLGVPYGSISEGNYQWSIVIAFFLGIIFPTLISLKYAFQNKPTRFKPIPYSTKN